MKKILNQRRRRFLKLMGSAAVVAGGTMLSSQTRAVAGAIKNIVLANKEKTTMGDKADMILHNGKIATLDNRTPLVSALAIK